MNEEKNVQVKFSNYGESGTTSAMCFTTLCFLFWANGMGFLGQGATLGMAAFQLGVFVLYAFGGITHIIRGEPLFGNIYCIFAAFFGGAGGAMNLCGAIAEIKGFTYSWAPMGWVFFVAGIVICSMIPVLATWAVSFFGIIVTGGITSILYGIVYMGFFPSLAGVFTTIATWSIFVCGLLGLYTIISTLYGYIGVKMDFLSKPLFAPKQK